MKLYGITKNKITEDGNDKNLHHSEINKVVLVHCDIVSNDYQHDGRVLYAFTPIPNKWFGHLLDTSPKIFIFLKSFKYDLLMKILNH